MTPPQYSERPETPEPAPEPAPGVRDGDERDPLAGWRVMDTQPYEPPARLAHVLNGFFYALLLALVMLACAAWLWLATWLPTGG